MHSANHHHSQGTNAEAIIDPLEISDGNQLILVAARRCLTVFEEVCALATANTDNNRSVDQVVAQTFLDHELPNAIFLVASLVRMTQINGLVVAACYVAQGTHAAAAQSLTQHLYDTVLVPLMAIWRRVTPNNQPFKIAMVLLWLPELTPNVTIVDPSNNDNAASATTTTTPTTTNETAQKTATDMERTEWDTDDQITALIVARDWDGLTNMVVNGWIDAPTSSERTHIVSLTVELAGRLLEAWTANPLPPPPQSSSSHELKRPQQSSADADTSSWIYLLTHIVLVATEYGITGRVDFQEDVDSDVARTWTAMRNHLATWFHTLRANRTSERMNRELVLEIGESLCLLTPDGEDPPFLVRSYLTNTLMVDFRRRSSTLVPVNAFYAGQPMEEQWHVDYHLNFVAASAVAIFQRVAWHERYRATPSIDRHLDMFPQTGHCVMDQIVQVGSSAWVEHAHRALETHGYVLLRGLVPADVLASSRQTLKSQIATRSWMIELIPPSASASIAEGEPTLLPTLSTADGGATTLCSSASATASAVSAVATTTSTVASSAALTLAQIMQSTGLMDLWNPPKPSPLLSRLMEFTYGRALYVDHGSFVRCKSSAMGGFSQPHADYFAYLENMALFGPLGACNELGAEKRAALGNVAIQAPDFSGLLGAQSSPSSVITERHARCLLCSDTTTTTIPSEHVRTEDTATNADAKNDDPDDPPPAEDEDDLLLCDICECAFHNHCLPNPLVQLPDVNSEWHCPLCANQTHLGAYTVWIPLQEIPSPEQGVLCMLPGSHRFVGYDDALAREWAVPLQFFNEAASGPKTLEQRVWHVPPPLALGDALMFNIKTVHGATRNRTDEPRYSLDVRFADGLIHPRPYSTTVTRAATTAAAAAALPSRFVSETMTTLSQLHIQ